MNDSKIVLSSNEISSLKEPTLLILNTIADLENLALEIERTVYSYRNAITKFSHRGVEVEMNEELVNLITGQANHYRAKGLELRKKFSEKIKEELEHIVAFCKKNLSWLLKSLEELKHETKPSNFLIRTADMFIHEIQLCIAHYESELNLHNKLMNGSAQ